MSQSHLEAVISAESDRPPAPLSHIVSNPSPSMFLYLLPPCLVLIAIDAALRISHRQSEDDIPLKIVPNTHRLRIQQVIKKRQQPKDRHRMLEKQRNFANHQQRLLAYNPGLVPSPSILPSRNGEPSKLGSSGGVRPSFSAFCDRLLLQNKIWKQQREIKGLRRSLDSISMANCSNAFKAFCDRLILSNNAWKLEKEVRELTAESGKIKRSRMAAVTRAAKQMVLDVRKERLIEEFVKELIADLEESRRTIKSLHEAHEREIEEMVEEWRKDYRRLSNEVERLQLAQEARLIEQELSNTMENELTERLALYKTGISLDEYRKGNCMADPADSEDTETLSGSDLELEEMSNTSTSTYVGSTSPNSKSSFDDRKGKLTLHHKHTTSPSSLKISPRESGSTFLRISPGAKSPTGKLDTGPYVGFSFNPLFFGPADVSKDNLNPKHVFSPKGIPQHRGSVVSCTRPTLSDAEPKPLKRVQWKV